MSAIFVTGIGTDVGKTIASAVLCEALQSAYWKPVQAGMEVTDRNTLLDLISSDLQIIDTQVNLNTPASPHLAAEIDGLELKVEDFQIPEYDAEHLIIEGAGGLHVPLNDKHLIIDLIKHLDIPVILVSRNYLGSINHTLLSIEVLKSRNIPILGVLFNDEENKSTEDYIVQYTGVKHLGRIEVGETVDTEFIKEQAKKLNYEEITLTC